VLALEGWGLGYNSRLFTTLAAAMTDLNPDLPAGENLDPASLTVSHQLDVQGLKCPLPILRTKKMLATMNTGEVLHVLATDPGAVQDFAAFAKQTGNTLLASTATDGVFAFYLRRK
jgi:tRNA 2-thiouridine synthesizing protein A